MTRLDDRERRMALMAATLGAGFSAVLWLPYPDKARGILLTAIGVLMSGLLALAARSRHRVATALAAALLVFGPWAYAFLLGLPFAGLASWLLFRGSRAAAEEATRRRAEGDGEGDRRPAPGRRRRRRAVDVTVEGPGGRVRPAANKRYTPPQRRR